MSALGFVIAAWVWFYPHPHALSVVVAALAPFAAMAFALGSGGELALNGEVSDGRAHIFPLAFLPQAALVLRSMLDGSVIDWLGYVIAAVPVALIMLIAYSRIDPPQKQRWLAYPVILGVGLGFGWALLFQLNAARDSAPPAAYRTMVVRHSNYVKGQSITVSPPPGVAKPITFMTGSRPLGSPACIAVHRGLLGWRWAKLTACA